MNQFSLNTDTNFNKDYDYLVSTCSQSSGATRRTEMICPLLSSFFCCWLLVNNLIGLSRTIYKQVYFESSPLPAKIINCFSMQLAGPGA